MGRTALPFRLRYTALPIAILCLSAILVAYFYPLLPREVTYHFAQGAPGRWVNRGAFILWVLTPQFFLTLLSFAVVWVTLKLSSYFHAATSSGIESILTLMGNMVALPQIILGFAMLDVFRYNAYGSHLMPLWLFALIIMLLGGIILGVLFVLAIRRVWETSATLHRDTRSK